MQSTVFAQSDDFVINTQQYTQEDGLSSNIVYATIKDNRGIVWISTNNGLNRFDGKQFKVFTTENGLVQNNTQHLYRDKEILWCLHISEKINDFKDFSLFHTSEERVIDLKTYLGDDFSFSKEDIVHINVNPFFIQLKNKSTYVIKEGEGLFLLPALKEGEKFISLIGNDYLVYNDSKNNYIRRIDHQGKEIYKTSLPLTGEYVRGEVYFKGISNQEEIWLSYILNEERGLFKLTKDGKVIRYRAYLEALDSLDIYNPVFYEQEYSMIYMPNYDAFAHVYQNAFMLINSKAEVIYYNKNAFENNNRDILLKDDKKDIFWITGLDGEISQLGLKKNNFKNYNFKNHAGFRGITSINNKLYFNNTDGLLEVDNANPAFFSKEALRSGLSIIKDKNNTLYSSSYGQLSQNPLSKKIKIYELPQTYETWAMYADQENTIWYIQNGLFGLNPITGETQEANYNEFEGLKSNVLFHFHEKTNGHVLLCTTTGLYEWHPKKGVLGRYWSGGKGKYYLPTSDIRHLYFDKNDQSYWLASRQDGLIHWQPQTGKSTIFKLHRSQSNIIHSVYADDYGFLWLSTENGIVQFNRTNGYFKVYLEKDGIFCNEFNRISSFQDIDGTIYFGTGKGITAFHPRDFKDVAQAVNQINVVVVALNQYLNKTKKIENLTTKFYQTKQIELQPGDRFFNLILTTDHYGQNEKAYYLYRIKGNKEDWNTSNTNEISISGLPYGNQILEIKASLENGDYSEILEVSIKVKRPFYLTWWFLILLIVSIISTTFIIIQWRTKRLNEQKIILQLEVQKRTEKITAQTKELKALDEAKSIFFANVSHELRTPITLIQGPVHSLLKHQNLSTQEIKLLKIAAQNTGNLLALVNEILDLTKLENSKLVIENKPVVLYKFLKRIISNFQSIAEKKRIELTLDYQLDNNLKVELDDKKVEKIINNLLSNALKFTPQFGKVFIKVSDTFEVSDTSILVEVKDNGRGISKEDIPNVFNRFYQSSMNKKAEGGLGIGLSLSMEFTKLMNGRMWIESSTDPNNHGSTFFLTIPKKIITDVKITDEAASIISNEEKEAITITTINKSISSDDLPTILLVEDNLDLQEYISFILSPYYHIVTAENGAEALNYLTSENSSVPSLVISDMMMPIMDGLEFLEKFKSNDKWRSISVIMLTARAELKNRLKALRIGVDDYMVKPFDEEELMVRIENLLRNYEERQNYVLTQAPVNTPTDELSKQDLENSSIILISKENEVWLSNIEKVISEKITNPQFSIDFLANELEMNRIKLYQQIKQLTGLTPNQYVRLIRLKIAKDYLENKTYKTVKEVAAQIGFQRVDYFSKLYKKEYGKMPSAYFS
jgi:signal transduction histidine kinase/DNA-binding response OmpR family regulator/streptogramin lyase